MGERFERNGREKTTLQGKIDEIASRRNILLLNHHSLTDQKRELEAAHAGSRSREVELKEAVEAIERELLIMRDDLSKKRSRLHSLQELEAQFAGYGQGVRTLFLSERFRGRFPGVLADFLETAEEHELALEAVLGEKLQYILSPGDQDALAGIDYLKETARRQVQFYSAGTGKFQRSGAAARTAEFTG